MNFQLLFCVNTIGLKIKHTLSSQHMFQATPVHLKRNVEWSATPILRKFAIVKKKVFLMQSDNKPSTLYYQIWCTCTKSTLQSIDSRMRTERNNGKIKNINMESSNKCNSNRKIFLYFTWQCFNVRLPETWLSRNWAP